MYPLVLVSWELMEVMHVVGVQVLDKALPPGTSDETRKFAKESIEIALKEWNDNNGKVDANVRLCLGENASKETLPNVAVEKVRILNSSLGLSSQWPCYFFL